MEYPMDYYTMQQCPPGTMPYVIRPGTLSFSRKKI